MEKSRQQFEEEFIERTAFDNDIFKINDDTGEYYFMTPRQAWYWWQASRESLEIELPEHPDKNDPFYDNFDLGVSLGIDQVKKVLIANGVKVK